jgi:PDZ domain
MTLASAFALVFSAWAQPAQPAQGLADDVVDTSHDSIVAAAGHHIHGGDEEGFGTLGYGPPGVHPGFQGFGLSFHLGYGYGGSGLGVGSGGGYPFYGGPGYVHPAPPLNRCGRERPFTLFDGPGEPLNYRQVGPLVVTDQVAMIGNGHEFGYTGDFGTFTGALPYPESFFAPYTAAAASGRLAAGASSTTEITRVGVLGINVQPIKESEALTGMRILKVDAGGAAEKAGLREGEVIRWANGYLTTERGNLAWIIANAAPDKTLRMNVRSAAGGERTVTISIP